MRLRFSDESVKPELLGFPKLKVKSKGQTTYLPRFGLSGSKILIEFGHYWGFGKYYIKDILVFETSGDYGLCLYGGDDSLDSSIDSIQMTILAKYWDKHGKAIKSKLKSEFYEKRIERKV